MYSLCIYLLISLGPISIKNCLFYYSQPSAKFTFILNSQTLLTKGSIIFHTLATLNERLIGAFVTELSTIGTKTNETNRHS